MLCISMRSFLSPQAFLVFSLGITYVTYDIYKYIYMYLFVFVQGYIYIIFVVCS